MPGSGPKQFKCVLCSRRTNHSNRRKITKGVRRYLAKKFFISTKSDDICCNKCIQQYYFSEKRSTHQIIHSSSSTNQKDPDFIPIIPRSNNSTCLPSPPSVSLNIPCAPKSHARCICCKRPGPKLINVSSEARFNAFVEMGVIIAHGSRCCPVHIEDGIIKKPSLENMTTVDQTFINRTTILQLINQLRDVCIHQQAKLDFSNIGDTDCLNLTGLSKTEFNDLFSYVSDKIKDTPSRSPQTSLGLFLLKMKSGMSNKLLATVFKLSQSSTRRAISVVRQALMRSFVNLYLGFESFTRESIIRNHTRPLAKHLFSAGEDQVILVLDGTYIYIQKSNNFCFQRRSYSVHKGRPLIKPMVVVSTTGHYITVIGPFLANAQNSDASILNHMFKTNTEDIKSFLKEDDILVLDRGFRDAVSLLQEMGIQAEMPSFLSKGLKQLTTEDANTTRLVTKIRWVVEAANLRIKQWKYFDHVLPTNQIPNIGDYIRIVCAIANKYFKPISQASSEESDLALATRMKELAKQVNSLQAYVEDNKLDRRPSQWQSINEMNLQNFPKLSEDQLRSLTCGVYQLKMSSSYIQEHIDGDSEVQIHKENNHLIRVRIQSRHTSSRTYMLWIKFTATEVIGWYCKCRSGARVVGVCSHVAAMIWYLGHARYNTDSFGSQNWTEYLYDAAAVIDNSDSDTQSEDSTVEE